MSQKKEKYIRRHARGLYESELVLWRQAEPPRWRFIAHREWKKRKPDYKADEKLMRELYR